MTEFGLQTLLYIVFINHINYLPAVLPHALTFSFSCPHFYMLYCVVHMGTV